MSDIKIYLANTGHGSGAFIVAGDVLIVYDCGSIGSSLAMTSIEDAKVNIKMLCNTLEEKYPINKVIIFVSHIHEDHFNLIDTVKSCLGNVKLFYVFKYSRGSELRNEFYYKSGIGRSVSCAREISGDYSGGITLRSFLSNNNVFIGATKLHEKIKIFTHDYDKEELDSSDEVNNVGFMLSVERDDGNVFFTGDVSYNNWPFNQTEIDDAKYLTAAHHLMAVDTTNTNIRFSKQILIASRADKGRKNSHHMNYLCGRYKLTNIDDKIIYTDKDKNKEYIELK